MGIGIAIAPNKSTSNRHQCNLRSNQYESEQNVLSAKSRHVLHRPHAHSKTCRNVQNVLNREGIPPKPPLPPLPPHKRNEGNHLADRTLDNPSSASSGSSPSSCCGSLGWGSTTTTSSLPSGSASAPLSELLSYAICKSSNGGTRQLHTSTRRCLSSVPGSSFGMLFAKKVVMPYVYYVRARDAMCHMLTVPCVTCILRLRRDMSSMALTQRHPMALFGA